MRHVKLIYLKGSKEKNAWWKAYRPDIDTRLWNVIVPAGHILEPFNHSTRTRDGLIELGVIR